MRECPSCGSASDEYARFCWQCATPLDDAAIHRERKLVTVLFCDLVGSTTLGEQLDPEVLQRALNRYFDGVREVIERHEGRVEKFIGDAVVAVFGVPIAHEDDALRAARAALDLAAALDGVNRDLRDLGVTMKVRVGINSGDIVLGSSTSQLGAVGGDTFNTAARLQSLAEPGAVLVGESTADLLAGWADLEPRDPVRLKGKAEQEPVFALLSVRQHSGVRPRVPFVGRSRQLGALRGAFDDCVVEGASVLVTVLGVPGIGKSRLVEQFAAEQALNATVIIGHTPTYGDAVAYEPVLELLRSLTGTDLPDEVITRLRSITAHASDATVVVDRLASMLGAEDTSVVGDTAWALRRLLEALADYRPVIAIIEDVHFGGDPLLDLLDRVAAATRGRVMIVCTARPELLDQRPTWGGGKLRSASITVGPLTAPDADQLATHLLSDANTTSLHRLTAAAEGNPLYLEQLAALVAETADGDEVVQLPPTIRALLAARLDRLDPGESRVLDLAAVEGRQFHTSTVVMLDPSLDSGDVESLLERLELRSLVSALKDGSWQFAHALIQETATRRTPKEDRADLHFKLAEHLATTASPIDELIAAHLERAARLRRELGRADTDTDELEHEAGRRYAAAGSRAYARMDLTATADLLGRAAALLPSGDPTRVALIPDLGVSLMEIGQADAAERLLTLAADVADVPEVDRARVRIQLLALLGVYRDSSDDQVEALLVEGRQVIERLELLGDPTALAEGWVVMEYLNWVGGHITEAVDACISAVRAAQTAGRLREQWQAGGDLGNYLAFGLLPQDQVARTVERIADETGPIWDLVQLAVAATSCAYRDDRAGMEAGIAAWARHAEVNGLEWPGAIQSWGIAQSRVQIGDGLGAELDVRNCMARMDRMGDLWGYASAAWLLPRTVAMQGRHDEALALIERWQTDERRVVLDKEEAINERLVTALAFQLRGRLAEAESAALEAVDLVKATELTPSRTWALEMLADIVELAGRPDGAWRYRAAALAIHESHGNLAGSNRVRALLLKA